MSSVIGPYNPTRAELLEAVANLRRLAHEVLNMLPGSAERAARINALKRGSEYGAGFFVEDQVTKPEKPQLPPNRIIKEDQCPPSHDTVEDVLGVGDYVFSSVAIGLLAGLLMGIVVGRML